ncbi:MAG: pilus assembly protein PilM [Candidatus Marinimicrobia bacterium]|nr:pilus assembly protein PilM [Candidatus Neomarinimicrobiota bacterium]
MLFKKKISVGIDIGSNMIKIIGIQKNEKIHIEFINSIDLYHTKKIKRPEDLNDTILVQSIRKIFDSLKKFKLSKVNISISSQNAIVRSLEMPIIEGDDLKSAILWKLTNIIPYTTKDIKFDYQVLNLNKNNKTQDVLVGVVPSSDMKRILDILSRLNLHPDLVDIDSLAVYHCFKSLYDDTKNKTVALFNIGAEKTSLIITNPNHNPYFISLNLGGNTITQDIMKNLHTSFIKAEQLKINSHTHSNNQKHNSEANEKFDIKKYYKLFKYKLSLELKRAEIYYQTQYGEEKIENIFLTGGEAKSDNYWNPLKEDIIVNNTDNEHFDEIGPFFTTALGLALRD